MASPLAMLIQKMDKKLDGTSMDTESVRLERLGIDIHIVFFGGLLNDKCCLLVLSEPLK